MAYLGGMGVWSMNWPKARLRKEDCEIIDFDFFLQRHYNIFVEKSKCVTH